MPKKEEKRRLGEKVMQVRFGLATPEFRVVPSEDSGWLTCNVGGSS